MRHNMFVITMTFFTRGFSFLTSYICYHMHRVCTTTLVAMLERESKQLSTVNDIWVWSVLIISLNKKRDSVKENGTKEGNSPFILNYLIHGPIWNCVQTFMVPQGWILLTFDDWPDFSFNTTKRLPYLGLSISVCLKNSWMDCHEI